jgi:endonuclease YncB( thermonuclease family)
MLRVLIALLMSTLAAMAVAAPATNVLEGKVVGVMDGDTVKVLDASHVEYKIRLAGIDAPEQDQAFGRRSKQSLSNAVLGKDVRIEWAKQDRYGRLVGTVWVAPLGTGCTGPTCPKTLNVNLAQLTVGLAWHYKEYEREQSPEDRQRYAFAEQEARARKAGLWSEPDPTPPGVRAGSTPAD